MVPQRGAPVTPRQLAIGIWAAGALAGLWILVAGLFRLRRLASGSQPIGGIWADLTARISADYGLPRPVGLLHSRNPSVLVTWGVARPKVILPCGADAWSADVANVVLRHELAHVRRRDWVVQMIAQSLRIVFWFNPLIWIVYRRMRLEAELACDDAVLARDIIGHEYASQLLALARNLNTTDRAWSAVLTMARPSTLERRFAAMLNPHLNRSPLTRSAVLVTLLIGLCICASLPAMKTFAAVPPPPQVQAPVPAVEPTPAAPAPQPQPPQVAPRTRNLPGNEAELAKYLEQLATQAGAERNLLSGLAVIEPGTGEIKAFSGFSWEKGNTSSAESTSMLIKLFDSSSDVEMKQYILGYLGVSSNPQAAEKVLAIARSGSDKGLQRDAISYLAMRPNPNVFDEMVSMYDASRDADLKRHILDYLGTSKDPRAGQKLFSIAQSDSDPDLRRAAVDYIATR
jgi:beta-lactamase regulating signal transducer with metallopeptidase domain